MKFIVFFLSLVVAALAIPPWLRDPKFQDDKTLWKAYKKSFKKSHNCTEDEDRAFTKFKKTRKRIEDHQTLVDQGVATYGIDLNAFADVDEAEFVKSHCGAKPSLARPEDEVPVVSIPLSRQAAPTTWDIRINGPGQLTPVKDQKDCGSCWAFATSAALENLYSTTPRGLNSLSEQQQLDCNTYTSGCDGGWFTTAYRYTVERGLTSTAAYPYVASEKTCKDASVFRPYTQKSYIKLANDAAQIQQYIRTNGACAICADANKWQLYSSGIFNLAGLAPQCNHAVTLVGYGPGYWLIKNSWGSDWGENGYIKVSTAKTGGLFTEHVYCPQL